jgi:hypothetical protein
VHYLMPLDIGDSLQRFTDEFFAWLPRLVGAIVILLIFWVIAKVVAKILRRVLPRTGMDRAVHSGDMGQYVARYASGFRPSAVISTIAYWFVLLTGVVLALSTLGIQALNNAIDTIVGYLPNVVAAILILVVALAIAGVVGGAITKLMGDTVIGKIAATMVPVLVITIAIFMALVQLRIAVEIVTGTFYIVLGAIALAAALAFGLGGRPAAQRLLDDAYEKGQEAMPQAKAEMALARDRASERAEQAGERMREDAEGSPAPPAPASPPPPPPHEGGTRMRPGDDAPLKP